MRVGDTVTNMVRHMLKNLLMIVKYYLSKLLQSAATGCFSPLKNKEPMNTEQALKQYAEHTGNIPKFGAHYKMIGKNMVDVFIGEGFTAPTRYRLIRGAWTYVTGTRLSPGLELGLRTALS